VWSICASYFASRLPSRLLILPLRQALTLSLSPLGNSTAASSTNGANNSSTPAALTPAETLRTVDLVFRARTKQGEFILFLFSFLFWFWVFGFWLPI
jgi:hypothetical protein